jgi:hypothetical protein
MLFLFASNVSLFAQTPPFTLTPSALYPAAVAAGDNSTATIQITGSMGFSGSIALTCAVTSNQSGGVAPTCLVSPNSDTPSATASLTVSTTGGTDGTLPGTYSVTVTGTSGSATETTTPLFLTVIAVPQDYTLSVDRPLSPSTVTAGNGATASILVTPVAGYNGSITLACDSITPAVVGAPVCSFCPQPIVITNGAPPPPCTLTISTFNTTNEPVVRSASGRIFYGFWMFFPGLSLAVAASTSIDGRSRRNWLRLLLLLGLLGTSALLLPSCSSTSATSTSNLITPKNTYTFTLNGVDNSGVSPSNTTTSQATVTLTVN